MHFAAENLPEFVEEQAKKRIALTVRPAWVEKTSEYARQIPFPFVEEVEQREAGRGPPVKFGLRTQGYTDNRAENGEESLQIGGMGTHCKISLDSASFRSRSVTSSRSTASISWRFMVGSPPSQSSMGRC